MESVRTWNRLFYLPHLSRRFQQLMRPHHIRAHEGVGPVYRTIDMRLSRKMYDRVELMNAQQLRCQPFGQDVSVNERHSMIVQNGCKAGQITGIRQRIENHHVRKRV